MAEVSEKNRKVAFLLCFFLGFLGVHRFYVGKTGTGIAQLLTMGGRLIGASIDSILILAGSFTDSDGKVLQTW
ncbi:MAG: TM2 domain-containing protein [Candidatus Sumerlaeota bacterium]|nr:TM2 domain-containing protein [Candidatus Sumerlaeota bacterium]